MKLDEKAKEYFMKLSHEVEGIAYIRFFLKNNGDFFYAIETIPKEVDEKIEYKNKNYQIISDSVSHQTLKDLCITIEKNQVVLYEQ